MLSTLVDLGSGLVLLVAWFAGYVSLFSTALSAIDPRANIWAKALTAMTCGLLGVPLLSAYLKRILRSKKP